MSADRCLNGKRAFVTGSTSGIGLAIAERLAAKGCAIGFNGFASADEVRQIETRFGSEFRVEAVYFDFDLRAPDRIYRGLAECARNFGQIDILVNNAGVQHVARVEEFPTDKWDEIIAVNLSAVFHCSKAVIPGMVSNRWGRIINIASVHGLVGSTNKSAYIAAKHGVIGLTKAIALENARFGVTCNAICPGYADTELIRAQIGERARSEDKPAEAIAQEMLGEKHPSGQFIEPDEIGSLAAYLCTDQASGITGAALSIDGGWSAH